MRCGVRFGAVASAGGTPLYLCGLALDHAGEHAQRLYVAPAVTSEDTFEVMALACTGGKADGASCGPPGPFKS